MVYRKKCSSIRGLTSCWVFQEVLRELGIKQLKQSAYYPQHWEFRANILDDNRGAAHKSRLVLNRPVYLGMSLLDLSNHLVYYFHYNQIKAQSGERCRLLYTDTNSLLDIQSEGMYNDIAEYKNFEDTSDYPKEYFLHSTANKNLVGNKMKDENNKHKEG